MRVEIDIPNHDLTLVPGMYVTAECTTTNSATALQIPASALSFSPTGPEVAVVGDDDRVSFHPVKIGRDMGSVVQIATGLKANDVVAMNISNQILNGDQITPHEEPPAPKAVASPVAAN